MRGNQLLFMSCICVTFLDENCRKQRQQHKYTCMKSITIGYLDVRRDIVHTSLRLLLRDQTRAVQEWNSSFGPVIIIIISLFQSASGHRSRS